MSPIFLDIVAITGLPIDREKLPTLFALLAEDLGVHFSKLGASYSSFFTINAKSKSAMSDGEHYTVLLYWLCKYFICINSISMVFEY